MFYRALSNVYWSLSSLSYSRECNSKTSRDDRAAYIPLLYSWRLFAVHLALHPWTWLPCSNTKSSYFIVHTQRYFASISWNKCEVNSCQVVDAAHLHLRRIQRQRRWLLKYSLFCLNWDVARTLPDLDLGAVYPRNHGAISVRRFLGHRVSNTVPTIFMRMRENVQFILISRLVSVIGLTRYQKINLRCFCCEMQRHIYIYIYIRCLRNRPCVLSKNRWGSHM